jgi:hypothetical protein
LPKKRHRPIERAEEVPDDIRSRGFNGVEVGPTPIHRAVIEAMAYIDRPLSASVMSEMFDWEWSLSRVSYHVTALARFGVLTKVEERPVRGAMEKFYFFATRE